MTIPNIQNELKIITKHLKYTIFSTKILYTGYCHAFPKTCTQKGCLIFNKNFIYNKTPYVLLKHIPKTRKCYTAAVCDGCDILHVCMLCQCKLGGWQRDGSCKRVELAVGGSDTNRATPSYSPARLTACHSFPPWLPSCLHTSPVSEITSIRSRRLL